MQVHYVVVMLVGFNVQSMPQFSKVGKPRPWVTMQFIIRIQCDWIISKRDYEQQPDGQIDGPIEFFRFHGTHAGT